VRRRELIQVASSSRRNGLIQLMRGVLVCIRLLFCAHVSLSCFITARLTHYT